MYHQLCCTPSLLGKRFRSLQLAITSPPRLLSSRAFHCPHVAGFLIHHRPGHCPLNGLLFRNPQSGLIAKEPKQALHTTLFLVPMPIPSSHHALLVLMCCHCQLNTLNYHVYTHCCLSLSSCPGPHALALSFQSVRTAYLSVPSLLPVRQPLIYLSLSQPLPPQACCQDK